MDNIVVSDKDFASNREALHAHGITHVLCCCRLLPEAYFPDDFSYCVLGIDDLVWQKLDAYVDVSNEFLEKALATTNGKVLIHCRAGRSRSVALCAAFLITRRGMSLDEAWEAIREARPCARPNLGFWDQLRKIEKGGIPPRTTG